MDGRLDQYEAMRLLKQIDATIPPAHREHFRAVVLDQLKMHQLTTTPITVAVRQAIGRQAIG